jgi:hypothetical protein
MVSLIVVVDRFHNDCVGPGVLDVVAPQTLASKAVGGRFIWGAEAVLTQTFS